LDIFILKYNKIIFFYFLKTIFNMSTLKYYKKYPKKYYFEVKKNNNNFFYKIAFKPQIQASSFLFFFS
jgi:hypothetical protein